MAPRVADLLGDELGRDEEWRREQVRAFEAPEPVSPDGIG